MMNKLMKKLAVVFTVATMALTAACSVSANDGMGIDTMEYTSVVDADYFVTIGQYGANVRMKPSMDGEVITTLAAGKTVEVYGNVYQNGKPSEWVQVFVSDPVYGGMTAGYVNECTFNNNAGAAVTDAATDYKNYMDTHYAEAAKAGSHMAGCYEKVVVDNYLALRSAPEYAYENEIEQLQNGEFVQILGATSGSYIYVCANSGNCGWVNAGFLY